MRWRLLSREDPERLRFEAKQRVTNWVDATPWEILVIIGLMLRMGVSPLAQLGYYWTQDHLVPDIAEAMTQKRCAQQRHRATPRARGNTPRHYPHLARLSPTLARRHGHPPA